MLAYIPTWVFAVLALLLWLGFVQSRPRMVVPTVIRGVAVGLVVYSLWGVIGSFGLHAPVIFCWAAGIAASAVLGRSLLAPQGMTFNAATRRILVPGSWLPLGIMLGVFSIKFGMGFAAGSGAPVQPGSLAAVAIALTLGLLSGAFFARARAIMAVAHAQQGAA